MLKDWELHFSDEANSYAMNLVTGEVVELHDFFKLMRDTGLAKEELRYEEAFVRQDNGSYLKEIRKCYVYTFK